MQAELRVQTKVLPGHRIEISSPELVDGEAVDVIVVPAADAKPPPARIDPRDFIRLPIEEQRRLMEEQAARAAELGLYGPDPEREAWQGGDIIE
jgi:hypothetical protein